MNILNTLLIGTILIHLGGFVRYLYGTCKRRLGFSKTRFYSLEEYIHGANDDEADHWDKGASHEFVNRLVGMIALLFIIMVIMYLDFIL